MKTNFVSFLIGFAAGCLGGLAGLGGGIIMVPCLTYILKLSQHQAHGTSLVAIIFTGLSGAITYALNGAVDFTAALLLALTAVFTAHAGARSAHLLPAWKLRKYFGIFLLFCSGMLLLKPYLAAGGGNISVYAKIVIFLITGLVSGFLSGIMGGGGGIIMVPAMVLLTGFSQHMAQGTSLMVMVPAGATGALTHLRLGNVVKPILAGLIPGILLGTYLGGSFAHLLPENALRVVFAAATIWMGVRYARTKDPEAC